MPHFKFLDMAIVFFVSIMGNEKEQGTIAIQNAYVEKWGISKEELRRTAIKNTWKEYPPEIKKMEDIISEIVLGQVTSEDDDEDGLISEEISYGEFSIDNVRQMIKEEVDKMRAQAEMDMYVLTNTSRNFGAACITYPGVLKEQMSVEEMNLMVEEVNEREVDSIDVLSNHVYQYKRELEEIIY